MSACAGRGAFPQKFNGSLFNVDSVNADFMFDADFRLWGGSYWLQNTRLIYWPMLINGDYELMHPFFSLYNKALPYAKAATQHFYNHKGAFFPETLYFWGSYNLDNFGWDTSYKPFKYVKTQYIRYYFSGSLEVLAIMIDYYNHTLDTDFAKETLIPFAYEVILFYEQHYQKDEKGKIKIYPSQALETYWDATNPMPPVAGLQWNLSGILELPEKLFTKNQLEFFHKTNEQLPEIPKGKKNNKDVFLGASEFSGAPRNHENPELYAIFPYRLYGVGKSDLERMKNSLEMGRIKRAAGWHHHDVNAAFLGFAEEAKTFLINRATPHNLECRFPAFWGPNYDWIPDQDHGSNIMIALQAMLMQTDGDTIMLFPAWPKEWDVQFKIHAPKNTILEGKFENGKIEALEITPVARKKDLVILNPQKKTD